MRHYRKRLSVGWLAVAAWLGAGALMAQGCGGAARHVETQQAPERGDLALGWLPADSFVTAHVDVVRLRESPYADTVGGWLDAWVADNPEMGREERQALEVLDALWNRTRELHIGATYPRGSRRDEDVELVVVMRGRFGDGALQRCLGRLPDIGESIKTGRWRGRPLIEIDEMRGIRVDASTWVFTRDIHVERVMQRLEEPSPGLRSDALRRLHRDLQLHRGAIGITLLPVGELRDAFLGELLDEYDADDKNAAAAVEALGLRLDVGDGLQLRSVASMRDASAAHHARRRMEEVNLRYRENAIVILSGLDLLLAETRVRVSGKQAVAVLDLDHAQAHALLFHWDRLARGAAAFVLGDAEDGGLLRQLAPGLRSHSGPAASPTMPDHSPVEPSRPPQESQEDAAEPPPPNQPAVTPNQPHDGAVERDEPPSSADVSESFGDAG